MSEIQGSSIETIKNRVHSDLLDVANKIEANKGLYNFLENKGYTFTYSDKKDSFMISGHRIIIGSGNKIHSSALNFFYKNEQLHLEETIVHGFKNSHYPEIDEKDGAYLSVVNDILLLINDFLEDRITEDGNVKKNIKKTLEISTISDKQLEKAKEDYEKISKHLFVFNDFDVQDFFKKKGHPLIQSREGCINIETDEENSVYFYEEMQNVKDTSVSESSRLPLTIEYLELLTTLSQLMDKYLAFKEEKIQDNLKEFLKNLLKIIHETDKDKCLGMLNGKLENTSDNIRSNIGNPIINIFIREKNIIKYLIKHYDKFTGSLEGVDAETYDYKDYGYSDKKEQK